MEAVAAGNDTYVWIQPYRPGLAEGYKVICYRVTTDQFGAAPRLRLNVLRRKPEEIIMLWAVLTDDPRGVQLHIQHGGQKRNITTTERVIFILFLKTSSRALPPGSI